MSLGYDIGDIVMQIDDKVIGKVIKFYTPTAYRQKTMILCDDGRKYHAPSETFIKVGQLVMPAAMPLTQELTQPLLVSHDYRNVKVAEGMTITIDVEELKRQLKESHYPRIGLEYGA